MNERTQMCMENNKYTLQSILNIQIVNNKTILELLSYEDYSHWWSVDIGLHKFLKDGDNRSKVRIISYNIIIEKIATTKTTHLAYSLLNYVMFSIVDNFSNKRSKREDCKLTKNANETIIYRLQTEEWKMINTTDGVFKNIYHGDIIQNLPSTTKIITPYETNIFSLPSVIQTYNKIKYTDIRDHTCFHWKYWSWTSWKKQKAALMHFKKIWADLSACDEWFEALECISGVPSESIKKHLKWQILINIPLLSTWYSSTIENLIKKESPSVIIMTNEQMVTGRMLVYEARKHGVKTIGIQHGTIANHEAYLYHDPSDVAISGKEIKCSFPVPDITCVWGEAEYNLLVNEAGYPADQVIVTGNPRYDYLGHASEMFSREEFCKRYNINPENKIILWVTQSHGWSMDENNLYFEEVFSTCKTLSEVTLIIKQHPSEGPVYRDLIEKYVREYNLDMRIVVPDKMSNTTEMVCVSDVIINKNSTTGQEAAAFHKPMIIMDFSKNPDLAEYVKEGVAVPAFSRGTLKPVLDKILNDGCDLKEAQDIYIKNHLYKIDGLASKRVADIIMKITGV